MFECHACFRRYVRAVLSATLPERPTTRVRLGQSTRRALQSTYAAHQGTVNNGEQDLSNISQRIPSSPQRQNAPERQPSKEPGNVFRKMPWKDAPGYIGPRTNEVSSPQKKSTRLAPGNISTELKYLKDPLKLSDHVRYVLDNGDVDKAMALVRMSSKGLANTVSWNHVIDWNMREGRQNVALTTYNEMKKRGQRPDSHTYLLLLRGLADNAQRNSNHTLTLGRALSIYHSMSAPNSKVTPNIIHTNAMLKVCARASDMDSIWDIASKLPEHGPLAANNWTFTTILNGMRMHANELSPSGETAEAAARRREKAIVEARQLWNPIKARWRQGDLMLDEPLVCAVGHLLLIGARPRDWDDVLSLIQQAMDIPRLVPRLGSVSRQEANLPRIRAPDTPRDMKNDVSEIVDEYGDPRPGAEFDAFDPETPHAVGSRTPSLQNHPRSGYPRRSEGSTGYARPGNNTLSLVLEACQKLVATQPALDYWNLLTDPHGHAIVPDSDNMHMLLRVLRQSRSSSEAANLLCDEFPRYRLKPLPKSFRIAMSACVRDAKNPAALDESAGRILDFMQRSLPDPDVKTLAMYIELAKDGDDPARVARALERVEGLIGSLRSFVSFKERLSDEEREASLAVFKGMIGCYDKVLRMDLAAREKGGQSGKVLTEKGRATYWEKYKSLGAFVTRRMEMARKKEEGGGKVMPRRSAGSREMEFRGRAVS